MNYPALVHYQTEQEYRDHFKNKYCTAPIETFDNLFVYFYEDKFEHAFFESSNFRGSDDIFSAKRAERIDWIEAVLKDPTAELYVGYDSKHKNYDNKRRVSIITQDDYLVIIQLTKGNRAKFITAYVADSPGTAQKVRNSPRWAFQLIV